MKCAARGAARMRETVRAFARFQLLAWAGADGSSGDGGGDRVV